MDLSKFTSNKKTLSKVVVLDYNKFCSKNHCLFKLAWSFDRL